MTVAGFRFIDFGRPWEARGYGSASDDLDGVGDPIDRIVADEGLSGVVRVDLNGSIAVQRAYGPAHRGLGIPTMIETQFAIASGSKGLTALSVMNLVERGDVPFPELVGERVCAAAGMIDVGFLRSDELPGRAAPDRLVPGRRGCRAGKSTEELGSDPVDA